MGDFFKLLISGGTLFEYLQHRGNALLEEGVSVYWCTMVCGLCFSRGTEYL